MIRRIVIAAALFAPAGGVAAQSNEAPKTSIGISLGYQASTSLWDVANQLIAPVTLPPKVGTSWDPDAWHLRRDAAGTFALQVRGTRYLGEQVGVVAEFSLSAVKPTDRCSIVQRGRGGEVPNADPGLPAVCDSIPVTSQGSSTAMSLQGGMILRPFPGSVLQPYFEGLAGIASMGSSTAALKSDIGGATVTIYRDPEWHRIRPTFVVGAGIATELARGLHGRFAVRDTWMSQSVITGSPDILSTDVTTSTKFKGYISVMVGLDIVLTKQWGRRY